MKAKLLMLFPYVVVFTTFNIIIATLYGVYGWVVFKKKYLKLSHAKLSREQNDYLASIKFKNVYRKWAKKYYAIIKKYTVLYFVVSEIVWFVIMFLTGKCVLICRIVLFMDILLLIFWIWLQYYFKENSKKLRMQHKKNLDKALNELNKTEQEV